VKNYYGCKGLLNEWEVNVNINEMTITTPNPLPWPLDVK